MTNTRTSINKDRLNQLESIESRYNEMVRCLKDLADNPIAVQSFVDRKSGLDISINRETGKIFSR